MKKNYNDYMKDVEIMELYRTNKTVGQEKMLEKYTDYIHYVIMKNYPTFRTEQDDMFQNGVIGLLNAMKTYDPQKGTFTTHCTPYIIKELGKHIRFLSNESSEYFATVHNTVNRAKNKLESSGNEVTVDKVMEETGLSKKIVKRELKVDHTKVSFDAVENLPENIVLDSNLEVENLLACMSESARMIVKMKVFEDMSFVSIAQKLGKSTKAIRKEYGQSMDLLRRQMA